MRKEIIYVCSYCNKSFKAEEDAIMCEAAHPEGICKIIEDYNSKYPLYIYLKTSPTRYFAYKRMKEEEICNEEPHSQKS